MAANEQFIHHVYFWLKDPSSKKDLQDLIDGLKKLSVASTIRTFHIGVPASTNRDVVERSYSVSWMLLFDSLEDEEYYQVDPVHLEFVETCKHLWKKVVVYDTENASS